MNFFAFTFLQIFEALL